ncbi:hypothetical protein R6Q59_027119 [Mikania micrantha]
MINKIIDGEKAGKSKRRARYELGKAIGVGVGIEDSSEPSPFEQVKHLQTPLSHLTNTYHQNTHTQPLPPPPPSPPPPFTTTVTHHRCLISFFFFYLFKQERVVEEEHKWGGVG